MSAEGTLDPGWKRVRFGDVVRQMRQRVDPETAGIERYVAGEHMDTDDLRIRRWGEVGDGYLGPAFTMRFQAGQVLYGSRRTYLRKVALADFEGICANTTFVMEPAVSELLPQFLPYVMTTEAFHAHSIKQSKGSVNPYINFKDLTWYEFELPPPAEQMRIVELMGAIDGATNTSERVVLSADSAKMALRQDLIEADIHVETKPLGEVGSIALGRVYPSSEYGDTGARLLRPGNIAPGGRLSWDSSVYLPEHWASEPGTIGVQSGDLVMNLTAQSLDDGFLGRVCLVGPEDEAIMNQRIARLRSVALLPDYLCAVLQQKRFRDHVARSAKGSKIKHLYERDFSAFEVPVPSFNRQEEVIEGLARLDSVGLAAKRCVQRAHLLRRAVLAQLLGDDRA